MVYIVQSVLENTLYWIFGKNKKLLQRVFFVGLRTIILINIRLLALKHLKNPKKNSL